MRLRLKHGLYCFLFLVASVSAGQGQDIPNLIGTWTSQYRAAVHDGKKFEIGVETTALVIEQQDGEFFTGVAVWEMDDEFTVGSDIGEEQATGGDDGFIGLIGFDGTEITMAEVKDSGIYRGRLLDENRMELTYIESDVGDAVLLRTIFVRQ